MANRRSRYCSVWRPGYVFVSLLVAASCAHSREKFSPSPTFVAPKTPQHEAALRMFRTVIATDTTLPAGRKLALHRLAQELRHHDVLRVYESETALVAHLPGLEQAPILLLSHIDTTSWDADAWMSDAGPTSGALVEGRIVGRGTLGAKGAASIMTSAVAQISEGPSLGRSIYLVVTSEGLDPQALQLKDIFARHPVLTTTHFALTPGGVILRTPRSRAAPQYLINHGEQGFVRMLFTAKGISAGSRLAEAINRVQKVLDKPIYTPAAARHLADLAQVSPLFIQFIISIGPLAQAVYMPDLQSAPWTTGMVMPVGHVSYWGRSHEAFVHNDARAQAWLDVALPETVAPAELRTQLQKATDARVHVDIQSGETAISEGSGGAQHLPQLAAAFGHKRWLRVLGKPSQARFLLRIRIPTFGFIPIEVSPTTLATRDRPGENVPVESLYGALDRLKKALYYLGRTRSATTSTSAVAR